MKKYVFYLFTDLSVVWLLGFFLQQIESGSY